MPPPALVELVQSRVLPRVALARPAPRHRAHTGSVSRSLSLELPRFAARALECDADALMERVDQLLAGGAPVDTICLELLAPTARLYGELWRADECDFGTVSLVSHRLQQVVHTLGRRFQPELVSGAAGRCFLLVPVPGEQHTLGLHMAGQFLERAGWRVAVRFPESWDALAATLRAGWFSVIGLSVGSERFLEGLPAAIVRLRRASRNPHLAVMVGGPILVGRPGLGLALGADATSDDAASAVTKARAVSDLLTALT